MSNLIGAVQGVTNTLGTVVNGLTGTVTNGTTTSTSTSTSTSTGGLNVGVTLGGSSLASVSVGAGQVVPLSVAASVLTPASFTGSNATLVLNGSLGSTVPVVSGMASGDVIDLPDVSATAMQLVGNTVNLLNNGVSVGSLQLLNGSNLASLTLGQAGQGVQLSIGTGSSTGTGSTGTGSTGTGSTGTGSTGTGSTGTGSTGTGNTGTNTGTGTGTGTGSTDTGNTGGNTGSTGGDCTVAPLPDGQFTVQVDANGAVNAQTVASGTTISFTDGTGYLDSTGTAETVAHLYIAAFGRAPDLSGLEYWCGQLNSGVGATAIADVFASSAEFMNTYGSLNNNDFVARLYQNVLGRAGDAGGISYWASQLDGGCSRGQILQGIASSAEAAGEMIGKTGDTQYATAYRLYRATLGRTPDGSGLTYWTHALQTGATAEGVANGFMQAAEFTNQYGNLGNSDFVGQLYQHVLGRAGESSGQAYWTAQLDAGASRAQILVGFSDSTENRLATASATHDGWVMLAK